MKKTDHLIIGGEFELFRAGFLRRQFRWRFRANNGRIVYGSTESYHNKQDCINTIPVLVGTYGPRWHDMT